MLAAPACQRVSGALVDAGAHGVDAEGRLQNGSDVQVGGRVAEPAAALVAAIHPADDLPIAAEQQAGAGRVAGPQIVAHQARGEGLLARADHTAKRRDAESAAPAQCLQERDVAHAAMAEAKVVADHDVTGTQALDQHVLNEVLGRHAGQGSVEAQHDQQLDAERFDQAGLEPEGCQAKGRIVGPKEAPRVGLEGDDAERRLELARQAAGPLHDRLVTAVNAVEVADGDDRAA